MQLEIQNWQCRLENREAEIQDIWRAPAGEQLCSSYVFAGGSIHIHIFILCTSYTQNNKPQLKLRYAFQYSREQLKTRSYHLIKILISMGQAAVHSTK